MTDFVIDSSVAIKWFVQEPLAAEAVRIRAGYYRGSFGLLVPDLIYAELGSVVWKKQRFQGLAEADAVQIISDWLAVPVVVTPTSVLLDQAFQLALTHHRTVYDMLYVALAQREKCPFVTADEKLVNAIAGTFPDVVWLANWP